MLWQVEVKLPDVQQFDVAYAKSMDISKKMSLEFGPFTKQDNSFEMKTIKKRIESYWYGNNVTLIRIFRLGATDNFLMPGDSYLFIDNALSSKRSVDLKLNETGL